jgi:quercetin dioxygenase-like cupin family protein
MVILRQVLGKRPSGSKARVRNYIASPRLGTERAVVHENVISPSAVVPWHVHATDEVIVALLGEGELSLENHSYDYQAGDVLILPPGFRHAIRNAGHSLLRQLCFFPGDPCTQFLQAEIPGHAVDVFNA